MATMTHRIRGADRSRQDTLERLRGQQGAVLRNRKQILRDDLPTATSGVLDFEEQSLDAEERGVGFSLLELTSRTLRAIEAALQRLEAGEFGTCPDCGRRIGNARLQALPFAALCLACQERHDIAARWKERVASARSRSLAN